MNLSPLEVRALRARSLLLAGLLGAGLVSGCAGSIDAPSLATRPQEMALALAAAQPADVTPPTPTPVPALDAVIMARLDASLAAARASQAGFARAAEPAKAAVAAAAGAAPASEAWIAAQLAISRLQRSGDAAANARSDVDTVRRELVERGGEFDRAALAVIEDEISAIETGQRDVVRGLLDQLSRR